MAAERQAGTQGVVGAGQAGADHASRHRPAHPRNRRHRLRLPLALLPRADAARRSGEATPRTRHVVYRLICDNQNDHARARPLLVRRGWRLRDLHLVAARERPASRTPAGLRGGRPPGRPWSVMASRWRPAESPRSGGGAGGLDEIPQRACPTADDRVAVREQEVVGVELEQPAEGGEQPGLH